MRRRRPLVLVGGFWLLGLLVLVWLGRQRLLRRLAAEQPLGEPRGLHSHRRPQPGTQQRRTGGRTRKRRLGRIQGGVLYGAGQCKRGTDERRSPPDRNVDLARQILFRRNEYLRIRAQHARGNSDFGQVVAGRVDAEMTGKIVEACLPALERILV